jgi:hypothetical protein
VVPLEFAPTAGITIIPKFHKIHRTFVFARPHVFRDLILLGIDLHERTRADDRIQRVIVGPDVSIKEILRARLLRQEKSHFAQVLKYALYEIRSLQRKLE